MLSVVTCVEEPENEEPPNPRICFRLPESEQLKPCHWWRSRRILLELVCSSLISILLGLGLYYHARSRTASTPGMPRRGVPSTGPEGTHYTKTTPPCLSPACLKAAARLLAAADPIAQPCHYFLSSCRAEGPAVATRGRQRGKELAQGKAGLEEWVPGSERQGRVVNLGRVTDAKTNTGTCPDRLADKQTALLQVLKEIWLGGWAVSGKCNRTDFNIILSLLMKEYATFPFFSVYVGKNPNDSNSSGHRKYIQIDQTEFHIPVEWDSKKQKSTAIVQTVLLLLSFHLQLLALLSVLSSSTNLHTGMFLQLVSELTLAASPLTHRLQQQLLYRLMTLRELQAAAPAFDWVGCLRATFHPIPVNQSDVVLLHNLPYIKHMSNTISKWQRDPEMTI